MFLVFSVFFSVHVGISVLSLVPSFNIPGMNVLRLVKVFKMVCISLFQYFSQSSVEDRALCVYIKSGIIYIYIYTHTHTHTHTCIYSCIYIYDRVYVCLYIPYYIYKYIYTYTRYCIYINIYIYTHIIIHIKIVEIEFHWSSCRCGCSAII